MTHSLPVIDLAVLVVYLAAIVGGLLHVPVSALFLFIGSALFAYYTA